MIKYIKIPGYHYANPVGGMFSHFYQFMEEDKETPMTILVHAYECPTVIFKGYVFVKQDTYQSVPITDEERKLIEQATGQLKQIDFNEFVKETFLDEDYGRFQMKEKK
jgi:hypothetical protein